jgi:Tfp pilus assembly protein PilO
MEQQKTKVIVLAAVLASVAIVVVVQLSRMPSSSPQGKQEVPEDMGTYEQRLMKAEMMAKRLPQFKSATAELEEQLKASLEEIPPESDHTWLSRQINRIAREIHVGAVSQKFRKGGVPSINFGARAKDDFLGKMWEIRLHCDYHTLGKFIAALERANRFLEIVEVTIRGNESRGQEVLVLVRYVVRKGR